MPDWFDAPANRHIVLLHEQALAERRSLAALATLVGQFVGAPKFVTDELEGQLTWRDLDPLRYTAHLMDLVRGPVQSAAAIQAHRRGANT